MEWGIEMTLFDGLPGIQVELICFPSSYISGQRVHREALSLYAIGR